MTSRVGGGARHAQHFVRLGDAIDCGPRLRPMRSLLHAQQRLHLHDFVRRNAERRADARQHFAARGIQAAAPQRRLQLDLHEHAAQVGTPAAQLPQLAQQRLQREIAALALREQLDRELHFALAEPELAHHRARGADLVLRDAAVGLGEMTHRLERGAEERFLHLRRARRRQPPRRLAVPSPRALSACTSNR